MRFLLTKLLERFPFLVWPIGIGSVILIIIGLHQIQAQHQIEARGKLVTAKVTSWEDEKEHLATIGYAFKVSGKDFTGKTDIDRDKVGTLNAGDALEVKYLPEDPTQNFPVYGRNTTAFLYNMMGGVFLVMSLAFAYKNRKKRRGF